MKQIYLLIIILSIALCLGAVANPADKADPRPLYVQDLVKIKINTQAALEADLPSGLYAEAEMFNVTDLDRLLAEAGGISVIRAHRRLKNKNWEIQEGFDRWFLIRLDGKMSAPEALAVFKQSPYVEDSSLEYYAYAQITPNDPQYPQNWGHNNTGQGPGGGGAGFDSNAPEAWDQQQEFGSPDIIIAIIDTGANYNHPDLDDNCVPGYDYGSNDDDPMDTHGHGSQCSGIAAGETNNDIGVAGVAGNCSIMPIKISNNYGSMTFTSIANGITHAADNGAKVISLSLGAESGTDEGDYPSCDTALYYAYDAGCVIFAATANSNTSSIAYPANHTAVISVGAASPTGERKSSTSSDGQNWWGSNYGVNIQDDPKAVDIMAATILPATTYTGGYSTGFNGTSCATPYAAGVAGLILSKDPGLTPEQVRDAIVENATDMTIDGGPGWDRYTGYGMINADAALATILPGVPTCVITSPEDGSAFSLGNDVQVEVNSADYDGSISHVAFYVDDPGIPMYLDYNEPYEWTWQTQDQSHGQHIIWAMSTDNDYNTRRDSIIVMLLQPANEGFESAMFDIYPWDNTSPIPWTIQDSESYTGSYAAKAGEIGHDQETSLSLALEVTAPGNLSFFYKVSSEANYDFLRFYIDGIQQGEWSGNVSWSYQESLIAPGPHTFTWTYVKDQGTDGGSDTAWLDHINFPPHNAPPFAPSNLTATAISPSAILLNWNDNSDDETEFYIERQSGGFWSLIDWANADETSIINTGLSPETSYSYRVRAYNANGASSYSNVAGTTTLGPDSPDNVGAETQDNQANLTWDAPAGDCFGYHVWRFPLLNGNLGDGVCLTTDPVATTSFTDTEWHAQNPGDYLWQVVAVSATGDSEPSISNALHKGVNGIILGSVTNLSGEIIENACVGCGTLSVSTNEYGVYVMSAVPGTYTLTASHPDFEAVSVENVCVQSDQQTPVDFELPLYTVATPTLNPEPGSYDAPVELILSCDTADAQIRYTLDGSDPEESSQLYENPIQLEASTTVKTRAYKLNCAPSEIAAGTYDITVSNADPSVPTVAGIKNIYPNPFGASVNIQFHLKDGETPYTLSIYNIKGELVYRQGDTNRGDISVTWDGRDAKGRQMASGIYFIRLNSGDLNQMKKVVLK